MLVETPSFSKSSLDFLLLQSNVQNSKAATLSRGSGGERDEDRSVVRRLSLSAIKLWGFLSPPPPSPSPIVDDVAEALRRRRNSPSLPTIIGCSTYLLLPYLRDPCLLLTRNFKQVLCSAILSVQSYPVSSFGFRLTRWITFYRVGKP